MFKMNCLNFFISFVIHNCLFFFYTSQGLKPCLFKSLLLCAHWQFRFLFLFCTWARRGVRMRVGADLPRSSSP